MEPSDESRRLDEITRGLASDDPDLAHRLLTWPRPRRRRHVGVPVIVSATAGLLLSIQLQSTTLFSVTLATVLAGWFLILTRAR